MLAPHLALLLVELTVHIAVGPDGAQVADDAWIDGEVSTANERLGAAGVAFTRVAGASDGVNADVATAASRDALQALVTDDAAIHVFVVDRVADIDKEGALVGGVTWSHAGHRYIIVSRRAARDDTLAHELGHYFGLGHETSDDNLMTPQRKPSSRLTGSQLATVRKHLPRDP